VSTARRAASAARSSEPWRFQKSRTTTLPASTADSSFRDGSPATASAARPDLAFFFAAAVLAAPVEPWADVPPVAPTALAADSLRAAAALDASTAPLALATSLVRGGRGGRGAAAGRLEDGEPQADHDQEADERDPVWKGQLLHRSSSRQRRASLEGARRPCSRTYGG
jgi:hypothetical protein